MDTTKLGLEPVDEHELVDIIEGGLANKKNKRAADDNEDEADEDTDEERLEGFESLNEDEMEVEVDEEKPKMTGLGKGKKVPEKIAKSKKNGKEKKNKRQKK